MRPTASVFIATSIDGFIARDDGSVDWLEHDSKGEDYGFHAFMDSVDALVMGRNTFDLVRDSGQWCYGNTPVIVLSKTLGADDLPERLRGNVTISTQEPRAVVADLGARGARRIYVDGGKVIQSFLRENLIDDLVLTRLPVLLGSGIPLFGPLAGDIQLTHIASASFASGIVQSTYRVFRPSA